MTTVAAQSVTDAAESAGISRSLLYRLIAEGKGPRVRKIGRRSVVLVEDRDSWLRSLVPDAASTTRVLPPSSAN
jgi:predicted DNA-binding transcriptional regulator AlpA